MALPAKARAEILHATTLDLIERGPDLDVIARQVTKQQKKANRPTPEKRDLANAITAVSLDDTMTGSSTLTITLHDEGWGLLDSGFLSREKDGRLERLELNYPDGSRFWWRLTGVSVSASYEITMEFMERAAVHLMSHKGPLKVSRAKKTRAQFIQQLAEKIKAGGGIKFFSRELDVKQPVGTSEAEPEAKERKEPKSDEERDETKSGGVNSGENLTMDGAKASSAQIKEFETAMDVAADLNAGPLATKAMVVAGIGESGFKAVMNYEGSGYGGVFQGDVSANTRVWAGKIHDTAGMARCFLKGGKGFQAGGAIALAKQGLPAGEIATRVEASGKPGSFYGKFGDEADKLIAAYGGPTEGSEESGDEGGSRRAQYNFEVGSSDNPNETYWDAAVRLAEEVKWALFLDGNRLYFDPEMVLVKQKPAMVIRRDHPAVVSWSFDWDVRHIATEMTLTLVCDPFEFRAGQVFSLKGFGPASTGTTTKRYPGRWLISEIKRDIGSLSSEFTLKQPMRASPEPASELVSTGAGGDDDASGGGESVGDAIPGSPIPGQKAHTVSTHPTDGLPGYPAFDYMAPAGTTAVSPVDGKVLRTGGQAPSPGTCPPGGPCGRSMYIQGGGKTYFLTHMDKLTVKDGDTVKQGQKIGEVANGPASWSSPHVHMGVNG